MPQTKAELLADVRQLATQKGFQLPDNLDQLKYPQVEELLKAVQAADASPAPATEAPPAADAAPAPSADASESPPAPEAPTQTPPTATVDGAAPDSLGGKPEAKSDLPQPRYQYQVAEGRMVVCKKGKVPAFAPISSLDLAGGADELAELVKAGTVVQSEVARSPEPDNR